jgi:hypothetical protein
MTNVPIYILESNDKNNENIFNGISPEIRRKFVNLVNSVRHDDLTYYIYLKL